MDQEYLHDRIGDEVEAIGGHYTILKEDTLPYQGREVLYVVAAGTFDRTCCGEGGCGYAIVPGYIVEPAHEDKTGRRVSMVEPVCEEKVQKEIAALIKDREPVTQVNFL